MEYLNFSLRDEIAQRRASFQGFALDEVAYVLHSAIDTFQQLQSTLNANLGLGSSHLSLRAETIFITV
jgi:hypothetical protein